MIGTRPNYNNVIGLSLIIILPFHDKKNSDYSKDGEGNHGMAMKVGL